MKKLIKKLLREGYNHVSLDYVKNKKPKLDRYKNFKQKNIGDFVLISDMYSEDEIKRFGLLGQILVFDKNDNTEIGNSSFGQIEDMGYDAIKLDNDYIVFDPRKIKSIKNKGDWGINNKNIFK
jgi:hypothetical protein